MDTEKPRKFLVAAVCGGVEAGRHHGQEKSRLIQAGGDIGVKDPARAQIVSIEENFGSGAGAEFAREFGLQVLLEAFDPDTIVFMAVADEYVGDVIGYVCHRCARDLQDTGYQIVGVSPVSEVNMRAVPGFG